jgi:hypothetical protein
LTSSLPIAADLTAIAIFAGQTAAFRAFAALVTRAIVIRRSMGSPERYAIA